MVTADMALAAVLTEQFQPDAAVAVHFDHCNRVDALRAAKALLHAGIHSGKS